MPLIALDTETGGFDPKANALLSISCVELDADLKPVRGLDLFILPLPGRSISHEAARINGYTPERWAQRGAVPLREAMTQLARWVPRNAEAVAHNAAFDRGFMEDAERTSGIRAWIHPRYRCSMATFLAVNDALSLGAPDAKLETLARMCGHWGPQFKRGDHAASDDALACAAGYRWLLERIRAGQAKASGAAAASA